MQSNNSIAIGDLVIVVRAGCIHEEEELGRIFKVERIEFTRGTCEICGHQTARTWQAEDPAKPKSGWPLYNLKKIEPLPDSHRREITAAEPA